jgi:hypothetical protein
MSDSVRTPSAKLDINSERVQIAIDSVIDALRPLRGDETRHVLLRAMRWWLDGSSTEDL